MSHRSEIAATGTSTRRSEIAATGTYGDEREQYAVKYICSAGPKSETCAGVAKGD